jgi:hypothetical protein
MGGPYKMCDQCDGPGTRCKRCPLEDEANNVDVRPMVLGTHKNSLGNLDREDA